MVPARAARCRHPGNLTKPSNNVLTFSLHILSRFQGIRYLTTKTLASQRKATAMMNSLPQRLDLIESSFDVSHLLSTASHFI